MDLESVAIHVAAIGGIYGGAMAIKALITFAFYVIRKGADDLEQKGL